MSGENSIGEVAGRFLRLCLQSRWDPEALPAARDLAAQEDIAWDVLFDIACAGGLSPLLHLVTRGQGLLPPAIERELRLVYFRSARRNVIWLHKLEDLLRHLQAGGVPVILLKGAALAEGVYRNPALRSMGDVDLLVREGDVPAAVGTLEALGYEHLRAETHPGVILTYENEVALVKPGEVEVPIEVHWSLFDSPYYQYRVAMDWFWQTALPVRIGETDAWMLGPGAQVLHLCAHLLLHHGGGEPWLLWLYDVAEVSAFYEAAIDWGEVLARAQAYDLVLPIQQILPRVAEDWHAPVPRSVLDELNALCPTSDEERVFAQLVAARRPVAHRFWADLVGIPNWGMRLRFAWNHLFPSVAYMQHRYRIPSRCLVPLYYPYRWFLGLWSAVAGRDLGSG